MAKKRILIVDDEQDILDLMAERFKGSEYDAITLSEGKEVIGKCKAWNPDLLIMDIFMPGIDGYSIALSLRESKDLRDVPIIFTSAKDLEYSAVEKRLLDLGYCCFVRKPYNFSELLEKIKAAIALAP